MSGEGLRAVASWTESAMKLPVVGAVAVLVSSTVHLINWFGGMRSQSVGPLVMVNVVSGVVIAVLLLRWRHWLPAFLTFGFGATTFGAFLISVTVGLLGVHAKWEGVYVFVAAAAEIVCVVVGATLLVRVRDTFGSTVPSRGRHRA
jgi:hypothetical protein